MINKELHFQIAKSFLDKNYYKTLDLIENNIAYNDLSSQFLNILGASKLFLKFEIDLVLEIFEDGYIKEKKGKHAYDCFINFISLSNINRKPIKPIKYYEDALNTFGYDNKLIEEIIYNTLINHVSYL